MKKRKFKDYEAYKAKQIEKTSKPSIKSFLEGQKDTHVVEFMECFESAGVTSLVIPGPEKAFLCLGARLGEEVLALRNMGYEKSIGVDLCPLSECVVEADFHNLPYPDEYFDGIYSNAVDHCFDLPKFFLEADRVLKPQGLMILHLGIKVGMGGYESLSLENVGEITGILPGYEVMLSGENKNLSVLDRGGGLNHELFLRK